MVKKRKNESNQCKNSQDAEDHTYQGRGKNSAASQNKLSYFGKKKEKIMMTPQDIDRMINEQSEGFWKKIYDGFIPDNLMDNFKAALLATRPTELPAAAAALKGIIDKKEYEITFIEMGTIINGIFKLPIGVLSNDVHEALTYTEQLAKMSYDYNQRVEKFNNELKKRHQNLMQMAGLTQSAAVYPKN